MMWTTEEQTAMSAMTTVATTPPPEVKVTPESDTPTVSSSPESVGTTMPSVRSPAKTAPSMTCRVRICMQVSGLVPVSQHSTCVGLR